MQLITYMSIYTIGDSHCYNGWDAKIIKFNHLGPILCYTFGKEVLTRCNILDMMMKDGDTIIFCFGEIDCRCHIFKHITNTITYQDIIDDIIDKYFKAIEINIIVSQIKFKNICVYNIVPPIQTFNTENNPLYPFLGTDEERKQNALYFNKILKEKCIENNYVFFDIYDKYTDENGYLKKEYSDNNVHINYGLFINNFIVDNQL